MSRVIFWPSEDDDQIQIEVTGAHDDFTIQKAKARVEALNMWVDCTRILVEGGRFDDYIAQCLREYTLGASENYYFELGKTLMKAQAN